jgi:DNA polymerase phi
VLLSPPQAQEQPDKQKHKQQRRSPPEPQQLQALWRHFVEGACLSSSHERKALALQLLQLLLPVMGPDMVPVLLSKQLLGCVATALKDKDSYLHASAKRCVVSVDSH